MQKNDFSLFLSRKRERKPKDWDDLQQKLFTEPPNDGDGRPDDDGNDISDNDEDDNDDDDDDDGNDIWDNDDDDDNDSNDINGDNDKGKARPRKRERSCKKRRVRNLLLAKK